MAITRTEFDALKARVTKLETANTATNTQLAVLKATDLDFDSRLDKLEGGTTPPIPPPPTNVLFSEDFSGYGDYQIFNGDLTHDGKMKNHWGIINIMHDASGYFARVESPYTGDGNGISAMLLTVASFSNAKVSYKVRTNKFTWTNSLNYHGAWFMARHSDNNHHYYEYMQKDGDLEVGKKDNLSTDTYPERQLFVGPQPHFGSPVLGRWYTDEWSTKNNADGTVTITFARDGIPIYNFTDSGVGTTDLQHHAITQQLLNGGRWGPYVEDAQCDYARMIITAL